MSDLVGGAGDNEMSRRWSVLQGAHSLGEGIESQNTWTTADA